MPFSRTGEMARTVTQNRSSIVTKREPTRHRKKDQTSSGQNSHYVNTIEERTGQESHCVNTVDECTWQKSHCVNTDKEEGTGQKSHCVNTFDDTQDSINVGRDISRMDIKVVL